MSFPGSFFLHTAVCSTRFQRIGQVSQEGDDVVRLKAVSHLTSVLLRMDQTRQTELAQVTRDAGQVNAAAVFNQEQFVVLWLLGVFAS